MYTVMLTEIKQQPQISLQHLASLYQTIIENDDIKNADKILDIYEKLNKQELVISFAGHFSAGKSSMINGLLGKSILPKSPIPTSANVVKIKSGKGIARVYFHNDTPLEYDEPYDIDMIKDYAKDKASIKEIEVNTKKGILPEGCVIIDTPGIDAADDADRLITESSLHLVDALFYVMDYNHVQSEVNLQFLKKVQEFEIPFYIIINQIDKHDERELTFKNFEENIKQTFDQWEIFPENTYYSSLVDSNATHNQFSKVKDNLFRLVTTDKDSLLNVERSVRQIIEEHKHYMNGIYEDKLAGISLNGGGKNDNLSEQIEDINAVISALKAKPYEMEGNFRKDLNTTLNNAYLMPSDLRDKAELFLESRQSDFKVGLIASKKKTAEEREIRLKSFLDHLIKNIEASIQWKLRDKFLNLMKQYNIYDQTLANEIQHITINYDATALRSLLKTGAKLNGDYVLNYTNDVSADVKQRFKKESLKLWGLFNEVLIDELNDELTKYEKEQQRLYAAHEKQQRQDDFRKELQESYNAVHDVLEEPKPAEDTWDRINNAIKMRNQPVKRATEKYNATESQIADNWKNTRAAIQHSDISIGNVLNNIEKTVETIEMLPGFKSIVDDLKRKEFRLNNRTFTIALFGAFSAGKSSFANALIGENVLPVSPNPTTAVINRINPVSEKFAHGTVEVKLKDEQTLVNDIRSLTKNFSPKTNDFGELVTWIKKNDIHQSDQLHNTHQSYLNAVIAGYKENKYNIAQKLTIDISDFANYVTDETKACYIESVDLYYDCSVTRDGITLVDTPGADSVNARHTNVAFDYIKHADAILYVTYYNHALSRADKDFLMQLGRVKDAFQLDKMFFIMNAADLAENNSELNMVLNYIEEQLTHLGIRFPRLYPISSKKSLHEKLDNELLNEQMVEFEEAFNNFVHYELAALTIESVGRDIHRALQSVRNYIDSLQLNTEEKEQFRDDLNSKRASMEQLINKINPDIYTQKISQKLEKQMFYVLERLSIRFHDLFKESFNPATITESGKSAQLQLERNLRNLLDYSGHELLQELRAVSLRIESFIEDMKNEVHIDYSNKSNQIDTNFILPDFEDIELDTPIYVQAFSELGSLDFRKELKGFNGTKAFFAKNEKEKMKEDLLNRLLPFAKEYIDENRQKMNNAYIQQWNVIIEKVKLEINKSIETHIGNFLSMVTDQPFDIDTLSEKQHVLTSIVAEQDKMEG